MEEGPGEKEKMEEDAKKKKCMGLNKRSGGWKEVGNEVEEDV